jgi:hypothetical protein
MKGITEMSKTIELLPDEQVVLSSDNDALILTNKRVRYNSTVWGSSCFVSITLHSVASCGFVTKSYPAILILAALSLIAAFVQHGQSTTLFVILAIAFIVAYVLTRRAVMAISSNGGETILVPTKGMNQDSLTKFIDALEKHKLR